jgi:hypothetical protein
VTPHRGAGTMDAGLTHANAGQAVPTGAITGHT